MTDYDYDDNDAEIDAPAAGYIYSWERITPDIERFGTGG